MSDYLNLGPVPSEEPCAQVGDPGYELKARGECKRFIELLRRKFGPEPAGGKLKVKGFEHDFGRYFEVIVVYRDQESFDYALTLEEEAPARWDEVPDFKTPTQSDIKENDETIKRVDILERFENS